jgi:hypothetical protein
LFDDDLFTNTLQYLGILTQIVILSEMMHHLSNSDVLVQVHTSNIVSRIGKISRPIDE